MNSWSTLRSYARDGSVAEQKLAPGTVRRVASYAGPYRRTIAIFLGLTVVDALLVVASPLLLLRLIDDGVDTGRQAGRRHAGADRRRALAVFTALLSVVLRWHSARIGEGLIYDLRSQVFDHVQRMPLAFFVRTQTGALISRLNSDVIGAQQAFTTTLSSVVSNVISLVVVTIAMLALSWQITLAAMVLLPIFLVPARFVGRRLAEMSRESMQLNAAMSSTMTERFNVSGALLVKLFGRPDEETVEFSGRARRVADIGIRIAMSNSAFFAALTLDRRARHSDGVRRRGSAGDRRSAHPRHARRSRRTARSPLRPAHGSVERPDRHHDGAGQLRAGLRSARPDADDP